MDVRVWPLGWVLNSEELTDVFKLWCWRRLLRVLCTARRSNQSIVWDINPEYSLEGLMLKLKLQYFGHLMQRASSLGKTLMLGKIESRKRRGRQKMRWLSGLTNSIDMNISKFQEIMNDKEAWPAAVYRITKNWIQLGAWTTKCILLSICLLVCLFVFFPAYSFFVFLFLSCWVSFLCIYLFIYFLYLWWPALSSFSFMLYLLYVFSLFWPCILLRVYYIYIILIL